MKFDKFDNNNQELNTESNLENLDMQAASGSQENIQSNSSSNKKKLEPVDLRLLIKSGVHFGHQTSRWSPKMRPFIWGSQNGIHLIDVSKTANKLSQAAAFLESVAASGKSIVWVGTKKAAQNIIETIGKKLNLPYIVHRWVGGTFTNNTQVRKAIAKLLHYEDIVAKSTDFHYSKKELNIFQKNIDKLNKNVGGIRQLKWPIGAVVVVDVKKEHVCIKEAAARNIPVVALVDTNCDPSLVQYVIPGNDDVPRAIDIIMNYLAQAVERGLATANIRVEEEIIDIAEPVLPLGFEEEEDEETSKKRAVKAKKTSNIADRKIAEPKESEEPKKRVQEKKETKIRPKNNIKPKN